MKWVYQSFFLLRTAANEIDEGSEIEPLNGKVLGQKNQNSVPKNAKTLHRAAES